MIKSIQYLKENSLKNLETIFENFILNPQDIATLVSGVEEEMISLGRCFIIKTTIGDCKEEIKVV